jgi:hypothetical protein
MTGRWSCLAALALLLVPGPAVAQSATEKRAPAPSQPVRANVDELPVSLDRIRRGLARPPTVEERFENFRLLTFQTVYGQAPDLLFFSPEEVEDLVPGSAVRYGGVTHQEFLQQVAPRNFRAPVTNVSGNLFSLFNAAAEKRREAQRKKEEERRRRRK